MTDDNCDKTLITVLELKTLRGWTLTGDKHSLDADHSVNYGTSFAGMTGINHKLPWAAVTRFHLTLDFA